MTVEEIHHIWDRNVLLFDDVIGGNQKDFEEFAQGLGHEQKILNHIQSNIHIKESHKDFFETFDYDWCFDHRAYRLLAECAFQLRLIRFLISIFNTEGMKSILKDLEMIVVREAITGSTFLQPRTVHRDSVSFIILPLGWFDQIYYHFHGVGMLLGDNTADMSPILKALVAKLLSSDAIDDYQDDNEHWNIDAGTRTLLELDISKYIVQNHALYKDAIGELKEDTVLDISQVLAFSAESFVIAHELAHILEGEDKEASSTANEIRADRMAFEVLRASEGNIIKGDVGISNLGLPVLSAQCFIFASNAYLKCLESLKMISHSESDKFHDRALSIQYVAKHIQLGKAEVNALNNLTVVIRNYLKQTKAIVSKLNSDRLSVKELAHKRIDELTSY